MTVPEKFDLLIRKGEVVFPEGVRRCDIGIRKGKIVSLDSDLSGDADEIIEANGRLIFPGFIDAHTHMGIPIMETISADDFVSGTTAAACGGVTTILDFTVQEKGQALRQSLEVRIGKAQGKSYLDYGIHINITDQPEKRLDEISELVADGFISFKVFSTYRQAGMMVNWEQFCRILQKVDDCGGLLMLHAEDNDLIEHLTDKHINAGRLSPIYHARSRTAEAEARAITRAAQTAGELDASLYIVHLSSRAGLEAALRAREQRVKLFLETCPQYLLLGEESYLREDGHYFITTPPLRSQSDCQALWQALADNIIDVVGTDHCPFTMAQKNRGRKQFHRTPNGLPGVETLFPLLYTCGVGQGRIRLHQLLRLLAENPARIFGLETRKGRIRVGADADLVIWNPNVQTEIRALSLHGNADFSPFEGMSIAGKLEYTLLRGQVLVREGEFVGEFPAGQLLRSTPLKN